MCVRVCVFSDIFRSLINLITTNTRNVFCNMYLQVKDVSLTVSKMVMNFMSRLDNFFKVSLMELLGKIMFVGITIIDGVLYFSFTDIVSSAIRIVQEIILVLRVFEGVFYLIPNFRLQMVRAIKRGPRIILYCSKRKFN